MSSPIGYALIEIKLVERAGMSAVRRRTFMDRDPHRVPQIMSARRHGEGSGNRSLLKKWEIQSPIQCHLAPESVVLAVRRYSAGLGHNCRRNLGGRFYPSGLLQDSAKALYLALQTTDDVDGNFFFDATENRIGWTAGAGVE
jgi:hypothetical protein